jgi:hypothetical protein
MKIKIINFESDKNNNRNITISSLRINRRKQMKLKLSIVTAYCALFVAIASTNAFSAPTAGSDEYSNPTPGATSAASKEIMDQDRANLACAGSLCTLFSVSVNKKSFSITTYVGDGMPGSQNGGTTNYYGNTQGGQNGATGKLGYGIQIAWDNTHCTKNVDVDKSVYTAVTTYMKELINSTPGEPSTYPQFTPAEQTMLLFYTTVMDLTKGSTCN